VRSERIKFTSEDVVISLMCGVHPELMMRLMRCVRMWWLQDMFDVSGWCGYVVYCIMLRIVWVPHSVSPGWLGESPCVCCHGRGMLLRSHCVSCGFHFCYPTHSAELRNVAVLVSGLTAARNQCALSLKGISVVLCARIVFDVWPCLCQP
jgi:hypothetical protein